MKTFKNQAAQGDVMLTRVASLPSNLTQTAPVNGVHVVAHSETGHNHVVNATSVDFFQDADNEFVTYMVVKEPVDLVHLRTFDTHETIRIDIGTYRVNRQREYTPEGYRRVAD